MSVRSVILCAAILVLTRQSLAQFIALNFPGELNSSPSLEGTPCTPLGGGERGICQHVSKCPELDRNIMNGRIHISDVACSGSRTIVCCPSHIRVNSVNHLSQLVDVDAPEGIYDRCGQTWRDNGFTDLRKIYEGNDTVEEYIGRGYKVKILSVHLDQITSFEYFDGSQTRTWNWSPNKVAFGKDSRRIFVVYMALLGNGKRWMCDGALINEQWVITAAHCFDDEAITTVRLGEYDFSDTNPSRIEHPLDYSIERVEIYPEYTFPSKYHDLALVELHREIPKLRYDLIPVCLPWGERAKDDIIGQELTLTGWGAKFFFGPSSPILQEANVTVLDPSICDASYSTLIDYRSSFPQRITKDTSLCAAGEDGADACQGDSGGPIVYRDGNGLFTLAGIVSTGNGCGLKEFPGIYAPLNNPKYLSWIKKVAFA